MNNEASHPREYGVLLPHFGEYAGREALLEGAQIAESVGFDAVWVRDHIVFHPHHHEGQDRTFIDPFVVLSAVAAVTETITLGTGSIIPHRHPIHAALLLGSLAKIAESDRVIVGFGLGTFDHEFEIIGMGGWDRREVIEEQVDIFRKLWTGQSVDHIGEYYQFSDADIHPTPQRNDLPIWYTGSSLASVRRAVEYCDGWMPGRMPRRDFKRRVDRLTELAEKAGKPTPITGVIPYTSPGKTKERAVAAFDLGGLIEEARNRYSLPDGREITELEDLDGAIIAGPPEQIVAEVLEFHNAGCHHFVFDLRLRFDDWFESLHMIGEEVLPALRSESTG